MILEFVRALRSEWLKSKRSFATALVLGGSLFTPAIITVVRLIRPRGLPAIYSADAFWPTLWRDSWESMAVFFLPLGAMLATSLMTHIETKSNAWKQVHTLPLHLSTIFLSKLTVIMAMLAAFLVLFNAGIYASGMIPYLAVPGVPRPKGTFFALPLLRENFVYFVNCLPIVAAQYLMALRISNVLIPIGVGFLAWVGALAGLSTRLALWWPYDYTILHYLSDKPKGAALAAQGGFHWMAAISFLVITLASYVLFLSRRERG